jgi:hypothetical protein
MHCEAMHYENFDCILLSVTGGRDVRSAWNPDVPGGSTAWYHSMKLCSSHDLVSFPHFWQMHDYNGMIIDEAMAYAVLACLP